MRTVLFWICILGLGLCMWSCDKAQSYSAIPEIHFKSLLFDSIYVPEMGMEEKAFLTFSFIDGDGDIGTRTPYDSISNKIHHTW